MIYNLNRLSVTSTARDYLFIGGIFAMPARVSRLYTNHTRKLQKLSLHTPETSSSERGRIHPSIAFSSQVGHRLPAFTGGLRLLTFPSGTRRAGGQQKCKHHHTGQCRPYSFTF